MTPFQALAAALAVMLAISAAGNAYLWSERDGLIRRDATVTQIAADTKASAASCSSSVDKLAKSGQDRDKRLEAALRGVAPQVRADLEASQRALQARPDDPKDLCGSLERYLRRSIKDEKKGGGQ